MPILWQKKKLLESEKKALVKLGRENVKKYWSKEAWIKATQDYLKSKWVLWETKKRFKVWQEGTATVGTKKPLSWNMSNNIKSNKKWNGIKPVSATNDFDKRLQEAQKLWFKAPGISTGATGKQREDILKKHRETYVSRDLAKFEWEKESERRIALEEEQNKRDAEIRADRRKRGVWADTVSGAWISDLSDDLWATKTDLEFKKQESEQKRLLESEKSRAKDIWNIELWFKKDQSALTQAQERATMDMKDSFNNATIKSRDAHKNLTKNINFARAGLGMPESTAETKGLDNIIKESTRQMDRLSKLSSTQSTRLQEDFQKKFEDLNQRRKQTFDENMRKLLDEMSISDLEGWLDTKEGLSNMRTKLQDVLYSDEEMAIADIQRYQFGINQLNSQIDEVETYESNAQIINPNNPQAYYVNMNGDPFYDENGKVIQKPIDVKEDILYESPMDSEGKVRIWTRDENWVEKMKVFDTWIVSGKKEPKLNTIKDEFGNEIPVKFNEQTWDWEAQKGFWPTPTPTPTRTIPLTYTGATGEASFKNNNPTWITFTAISENGKQLLRDAWVEFFEWTARPSAEWGSYMWFETKEDWLLAHETLLTQAWTDDIYDRLKQWVWTAEWDSYASSLMEQSGIQKWTKFSELSEDQTQSLLANQIKRESPAFYKQVILWEEGKTGIKEYTTSDKSVMDAYLKNPNSKDNRLWLKRAWLTTVDVDKYKESTTLSSADNLKVRKMLAKISWKTVTNEEAKQYAKIYLDFRNEGMNDQQIKDKISWYYLIDENKDSKEKNNILEWLKKYAYWVNEDLPSSVAEQINLWNYNWAVTGIENERFQKAKLDNPAYEVENTLNIFNRLDDWLKKYEDSFWPFSSWTSQNWNTYIEWNPEFTETLSNMATFVAEYRNKISGTAVTESESKFLENVIPTVNQAPWTIYWKLNALTKKIVWEYNSKRNQVGLPRLSKAQIIDNEQKMQRYVWEYKTPVDISKSKSLWGMSAWIGSAIWTGRWVTGWWTTTQSQYSENDLKSMFESWNFNTTGTFSKEEEDLISNY